MRQEPPMNGKNGENEAIRNILKTIHPDIVKTVSPELYDDATKLGAMLSQAKEGLVKKDLTHWPQGTFAEKDGVRFIRKHGEIYIRAENDTLIGAPRELLKNLDAYIRTGELPTEEWVQEVNARNPSEQTNSGFAEDPHWAEIRKEQKKILETFCVPLKDFLEKTYSFKVKIDDETLDANDIKKHLEQMKDDLGKLSPELQEQVKGTEVSFYKMGIFPMPYGQPAYPTVKVPGYFLKLYDDPGHFTFGHAAESLRGIRARHADKVSSPLSLPTDNPFFWIQDLLPEIAKFGITVDVGKYDENGARKALELNYMRDQLSKLDNKYLSRLKGTRVTFHEQGLRGEVPITIRYPWPGAGDMSIGGMISRVKDVVDNKYI